VAVGTEKKRFLQTRNTAYIGGGVKSPQGRYYELNPMKEREQHNWVGKREDLDVSGKREERGAFTKRYAW